MVFAYLILVHRNPGQLRRLVDAIMEDNVFVFIHVDRKSCISDFKNSFSSLKNVVFCSQQKQVSWGGFGMIEATLELIHTMFSCNIQPDYVHLMSGQDFPLQPNEKIQRFFSNNAGRNFLEAHIIPSPRLSELGLSRIRYKWYIDEKGYNKAVQLVEKQKQQNKLRPYFTDIQPYNGSQWWSLTGKCVKWIYEICKQGNRLYDFYKYTFVPDEMLFHTMLKNSEWNNTIINDNLRNIDWGRGPEYPRIWRNEDFEQLIHSEKLFARKFDAGVDNKIIIRIEKIIKQSYMMI